MCVTSPENTSPPHLLWCKQHPSSHASRVQNQPDWPDSPTDYLGLHPISFGPKCFVSAQQLGPWYLLLHLSVHICLRRPLIWGLSRFPFCLFESHLHDLGSVPSFNSSTSDRCAQRVPLSLESGNCSLGDQPPLFLPRIRDRVTSKWTLGIQWSGI